MRNISDGGMLEVDNEKGTFRVSRNAFISEKVLTEERTNIFDKCWLYVGHASELPKAGSFVTRSVGGRNLLFNRDATGQIRVFLNTCPHRGSTLCRERTGTAKSFTCSYHGWVFGAEGKLKNLPGADSYSPAFNSDGCADLVPAPKSDQYRDFWFVCFDTDAQSLKDYLVGAAEYLDLIADQSSSGMEIVSGQHEYAIRANWKLLVENSFDGYHAETTHSTYFDYLKNANGSLAAGGVSGVATDLGNGHAVIEYTAPWGRPVAKWVPAWGESNKPEIDTLHAGLVAQFGPERADRIANKSRNLLIFPNFVIIDIMSLTLRTFYPREAGYMEINAWALAPKGESHWLRKNRLESFLEFLGPGGFATPDDVEMLEQCQRGYSNAKEAGWNDISKGMLKDKPTTVDEHQIRVFWRQWNEKLHGTPNSKCKVIG